MKKQFLFIVFPLLILCFTVYNFAYSKSTAISNAPLFSIYDNYPKLKFKGNVFILKYSTYSDISNDYRNEYYTVKENKSNWTERIIIDNYIKFSDPIEYGDNLLKTDKALVSLYQRKYYTSEVGTDMNKYNGKIKIVKAEPNKNGPGLQVAEYNYRHTSRFTSKNKELEKLFRDRAAVELLQLKIPPLYKKEINIR